MIDTILKNLRKQNKFTQDQLAETLQVPVRTYGSWERGERQPDYVALVKIADFYNVTTDYLLGRKPLDVVTVYADPPPAPKGFASVVISAGEKEKTTPDSLEKQIKAVLAEELKKRGL